MKLAISNIAWEEMYDTKVYALMQQYGYNGLEIAPTRIFPERPYDQLNNAAEWARELKDSYGFEIPSIQSIWYGKTEKIFGSKEDYKELLNYTKKAIDFCEVIGCKNLVFGCPKNRNIPEGLNDEGAVSFFKELGDYAYEHDTVLAMEANPPIYNTNYINDTKAAIELIKRVDSAGFLLNLDLGTMIENGEKAEDIKGYVSYINHVHISEPGLKKIEKRQLHCDILNVLREEEYRGYVSVEMGKQNVIEDIEEVLGYVKEVI